MWGTSLLFVVNYFSVEWSVGMKQSIATEPEITFWMEMWIKLMWFFLLKNVEPLARNGTTTILQINEKWTLQQRYLGQRPFNELTKNECDNNDMGEDNLSGYQAFWRGSRVGNVVLPKCLPFPSPWDNNKELKFCTGVINGKINRSCFYH